MCGRGGFVLFSHGKRQTVRISENLTREEKKKKFAGLLNNGSETGELINNVSGFTKYVYAANIQDDRSNKFAGFI